MTTIPSPASTRQSHRPRRRGLLFAVAAAALLALPLAAQQEISEQAAVRFLDQATFGATPDLVAHVQQTGFDAFLTEQFALPPSTYDDPVPDAQGNTSWRPTQQRFFYNAVNGEDQLRQRMAWALLQIVVTSGVKLNRPERMLPSIRMLQSDAFGKYRALIQDVTLSPAMGHYLDMVNNNKPTPTQGANENYARELLQIFTIGLNQLNPDGTPKLDAGGNPIPTYDQETIEELARVFTGWTYAPLPAAASRFGNPANWNAPMTPIETHHDTGVKVLFGSLTLAAGQTAETDLAQALDAICSHANVAPFISRNLIQHFVTSEPTPAYVARVAHVFSATRGDLKSVLRAILLDTEARHGDDGAAPRFFTGHLREPVLYITDMTRALGAVVAQDNSLPDYSNTLGQNVFYSPTVFNYYPPSYVIPDTQWNAPEFAILSGSLAMLRADFANALIYGRINGVSVDLARFTTFAATPPTLLGWLNAQFFHGAMTTQMRDVFAAAMHAQTSTKAAAQTALYLAGSSSQYQVMR